MDKIITKYEYDEKGRMVKQTLYKNNKIESEFIVAFDDKNNTKVEVGYNNTTFTQYDKDGDILFVKYYRNPKPYTSDIDEKNNYYKEEYKYNENKTKVTLYAKEENNDSIYEIDKYFCKALNKYIDSKIVCKCKGKTISAKTFKHDENGRILEIIEETNL